MISINQTVNSDAFNLITDSYDIDCNTVNRNKNKYNVSQLVCENWGSGGAGGGR